MVVLGCFFGLELESASGCGEKRLEMVKKGEKGACFILSVGKVIQSE
jgi:hypothetical protein